MARRFDGGSATDRISAVAGGSAVQAPVSYGCWIKPIAYATGRCIVASGTTTSTITGLQTGASTAQRFGLRHTMATTAMVCEVAAPAAGTWVCLVGVISDTTTAANNKIYLGAPATVMAAAAHAADTNGVGSVTTNTSSQIGKTGTATSAVNADIAQAFCVPWAMTLDEVERFRQGDWSVLFAHGIPNFFFPMEAGGAALRDFGVNAQNATITGTPDVVEDPPIYSGWGGGRLSLRVERRFATQSSQSVDGGMTPTGVALKSQSKSPSGGMTPAGTAPKIIGKPLSGAFT